MSHENFLEIAASVSPPRTLYLLALAAGLGVLAEATGIGREAVSSTLAVAAVRMTADAASLMTS